MRFMHFFTGERHGYYADFGEAEQLVKVLNQPYVYAGEYSPFRDREHGAVPRGWPATDSSFSCKTTTRSAIARGRIGSVHA